MQTMKYQCPVCNSFDVKKNEFGDVICFSCFSICSDNDLDTMLWGRALDAPPPFPEKLERKKNKRTHRERNNNSNDIMRRVI